MTLGRSVVDDHGDLRKEPLKSEHRRIDEKTAQKEYETMDRMKKLSKELNKKIKGKLVDKAAEDIASQLYKETRQAVVTTVQRVADEFGDEDNRQRLRAMTERLESEARNLGEHARRVGQEAWKASKDTIDSLRDDLEDIKDELDPDEGAEDPPDDQDEDDIRAKLMRDLNG